MLTGLSGSGKSSLAFDTLYAEGQRRYVESLSAYARQFLSMMDKPDVDSIEGLSPAIAIEQKAGSHNPRSTVGTVTEIYDYLRLLYARAGLPRYRSTGIEPGGAERGADGRPGVAGRPGPARAAARPAGHGSQGRARAADRSANSPGRASRGCGSSGTVYELDQSALRSAAAQRAPSGGRRPDRVRPEIAQRLAESFETSAQAQRWTDGWCSAMDRARRRWRS